jgi:hypothetical protein
MLDGGFFDGPTSQGQATYTYIRGDPFAREDLATWLLTSPFDALSLAQGIQRASSRGLYHLHSAVFASDGLP